MQICPKKVTEPGEYKLEGEYQTITITDTQDVSIYGGGIFIDGTGLTQPDINILESSDIKIVGTGKYGIILNYTRVKGQGFAKNVWCEGILALNSHISSFSFKTEWHVDTGDRFDDQDPSTFKWDYGAILRCMSVGPSTEGIYVGSQKPDPHYFEKFDIVDFAVSHSGREGVQVANVKKLTMNDVSIFKAGLNNTPLQNNGAQISNSSGEIDNLKIRQTNGHGLMIFSYDLIFRGLEISDVDTAIFIGQVDKRFPDSPLLNKKPIMIYNADISRCTHGLDVRTDEMEIHLIEPRIHGEHLKNNFFHPSSQTSNVHLINPIYL